MKRFACLLAAVAFFGACSTHRVSRPKEIYASAGMKVRLLPPSAYGGELSAVQEVRVSRGGAELVVTGIVKILRDSMQVIALADMARLMTLNYTPAGIECEVSPLVPLPKIRPEYILFDVQLAYFPADAINAALPKGMSFCEDGGARALYRGEKKIVSIARDGGTMEFANLERSYSCRIVHMEN